MSEVLLDLVSCLADVLICTTKNKPLPTGGGHKPQIKFNETSYNFADIPSKALASHRFVFTNTGIVPLVINSVSASWACAVYTYTKEAVMPGKTGTINVTFNAMAVGSFTKLVTVNTNARQVSLMVTGNVVETSAKFLAANNNK
jgi:hypothetical protein